MSVQLFSSVFDVGLSERLIAALGALPCDFHLGADLMQRLAKPSDYVPMDILGRPSYVLPWEPRLCPGNPADDPKVGASLYNEFAQEEAKGVQQRSPQEQVADIIEWTIATPGEAARSLAADLTAAYLGKHRFLLDDLEHWEAETKVYRAHLVFHHDDIQELSPPVIMALRVRAVVN